MAYPLTKMLSSRVVNMPPCCKYGRLPTHLCSTEVELLFIKVEVVFVKLPCPEEQSLTMPASHLHSARRPGHQHKPIFFQLSLAGYMCRY